MIYLGNAFSLQMLDLNRIQNIKIEPLTIEEAKNSITGQFTNCIGHADTAAIVSYILEIPITIPQNRINIQLTKEDTLIVAQLTGGRLPEGVTELPEGFSLTFVKVQLI